MTDAGEPDDRAAKHVAQRQANALAECRWPKRRRGWNSTGRARSGTRRSIRPSTALPANRAATARGDQTAALPADLRFHGLRHTYASLCAASEVEVRKVAKFMGHANTTTTEHIYTHLFDTEDNADDMAALDALEQPKVLGENVMPLCG